MFLLSSIPRALRLILGWLLTLLALAWMLGALWFDFPIRMLRHPLTSLFLCGILADFVFVRPRWKAKAAGFVAVGIVAGWWLTLKPGDQRSWQPDVAETAWAEIKGDEVTLHNVRNCEYRTEDDYTTHWESRTVHLSQIIGLDLALAYWGSPLMAHPISSFRFADASPICFSIEARKVVGQDFSAVASMYRQAQLIYIVADERDSIRVRAVYRHGEDVYLYRVLTTPAQTRDRFLEYVKSLNQLHAHPRWYNVLTTNCTTSIREQRPTNERIPWDWRILVNGRGDELLYERHLISSGGLSFPELKLHSRINDAARLADKDPNFSQLVREGIPGFAKK
ncbi:MAG TPA: DUF4105 domain-containing protein [Chthoniobacterales bacterium]|jgi:hypothetical protein